MNSLKSIYCTALAALVLAVSCNTPKPEETRQDKLTAYLVAFLTGYDQEHMYYAVADCKDGIRHGSIVGITQEEYDALVEAFPFE